MSERHQIIIVGGGAGGLELATKLGRCLGKKGKADVTLIDQSRTHIWKPLLHEVAAGTMDSCEDKLEYLAQARWHGFRFRLGRMSGLERAQREVVVAPTFSEEGEMIIPERRFHYDTLVMAVGSVSNDFGIPGVKDHCLFLDSTEQAERFQRNLLNAMIHAHTQAAPIEKGQLDVAIVGAGATGVELAAQLHAVSRQLAAYGLDTIDPAEHIRIHIIEAGPRILPALPERISKGAREVIEKLGVTVHVNERVVEVTDRGIHTSSGEFIPAAFRVWAAGIKAPEFMRGLAGLESNGINQWLVKPTLQTTADENIFALGDCAACALPSGGNVPPRAQAAHQQAALVGRNIRRRILGMPLLSYRYRDYGSLIAMGRYSTVGSLMGNLTGSVFVSGYLARIVYLSLYKMHQAALYGWPRTLFISLLQFLRKGIDPQVKLH